MFYAKPATRNNFDICKKYLTSDVNYILHPVSKCLMQLTVDNDTEIVPQCYETVHRKAFVHKCCIMLHVSCNQSLSSVRDLQSK